MLIYQANFGERNRLWPACRDRGAILLYEDAEIFAARESGDEAALRAAIIAYRRTFERSRNPASRSAVGRDVNMVDEFLGSAGDVWLHVGGNDLYWCVSAARCDRDRDVDPRTGRPIVTMWKRTAEPWRNVGRDGARLDLRSMDPDVRAALKRFPRTFARRRGPLAERVATAIGGGPGAGRSPAGAGTGGAAEVEARWGPLLAEMREWALEAAARSGVASVQIAKDKPSGLGRDGLDRLLRELLLTQRGRCAYTGLAMLDGSQEPAYRRASLDRIDSGGGYERGNLHLVCRFVNRMKGDTPDREFRECLRLVRSAGPAGGAD
jgi:hypothetical protein